MNENENEKAEPHEHSKYMPRSWDGAEPSEPTEVTNKKKLKLVTETVELPKQDSGQEDQKPSYPIAPIKSSDGSCTYHSRSSVSHFCTKCKTGLCRVCAFIHPSKKELAFCPKCVSRPLNTYPSNRRNSLIIAYTMAILGTLSAGITFSGILHSAGMSDNAVGLIMMASMLLPTLIGSSFSYGAMDATRGNGIAVWFALCWNAMVLSGITALTVIGVFMS